MVNTAWPRGPHRAGYPQGRQATAKRAPVAHAGLLVLLILLTVGCSPRFESFAFQAADGTSITLTQSRRAPRGQEARFAPGAAAASPVYRLSQPYSTASPGQAFALSYTGDLSGCTLTVFSDKRKVLTSAALPRAGDTTLRYLVPLERGARIWGYQLAAAGGAQGSLTLMGAGTQPFIHGFSIDGEALAVDGSVEVASASARGASARIPVETRDEMGRGTWLLSLTTREGFTGGRVVFEAADGQSAAFAVAGSSSPIRLDFARGSIPFLPERVRFTGGLRSLSISQVSADAPIPADPGVILGWERSAWRKPDFELFSWTRFPGVLILDIADYGVQDALLKRIAFFVEKVGHAGKVETHAALAGLHGYNAHDYRAEDLARFFTEAERMAGGLSIQEQGLAQLLVENGVLRKANAGYAPGEGCIISISRESPAFLRELLLTHECFHGVYFTLPAFRDATEKEWESLSDVEKEAWQEYLGTHAYNTADHYLLVNEFQSYLMQQKREDVNGFQAITLARMRQKSSRAAKLAKELLTTHPNAFYKEFDVLDKALQAAGGPPGGRAVLVEREGE